MTDPRTLLMRPVDQPLYGEAAKAAGRLLRLPVDEPLYGEAARVIGQALTKESRN
jgi:hypothetical protein